MKNLILLPLLLVSSVAFASSTLMEVVGVQDVYKTRTVNVPVQIEEQQCVNRSHNSGYDNSNWGGRQSDGLLEKGVDGLFGSTGGLIGTATGVAIIDEFGGNDVAKILGGILGNKIGNDISDKRSNRNIQNGVHCEMVTRVKYVRQQQRVLSHYLITVTDGYNEYNIKRQSQPFIGETIRVNVSVW
jgi:hypothetical protein